MAVASIEGVAVDRVASVGAEMEEEVSGVGATVAKGSAGVGAGVGDVGMETVGAASPADSITAGGLVPSIAGLEARSFSGGGVDSEVCRVAFGSSEESGDAVSKLLKVFGVKYAGAETDEPAWGMEKAGLVFDSEAFNKPLKVTPFATSAPVESSAGFWRPTPKLNCTAPLLTPNPDSPKVNEEAADLGSVDSSPWPTRSPEKLPSVSPPTVLRGCGSILRPGVEAGGVPASPDVLEGRVGYTVPRETEVDFELREKVSSTACPNPILPFPKENLLASFTGDT